MRVYDEFARAHAGLDFVKTIASLQLIPQNHGKNVRLEELIRIAVRNYSEIAAPFDIEHLEKIIHSEYSESKYEDRPVNLFTENAMFCDGNYVVFPGITESGTNVLNNLIKAIYVHDSEKALPGMFRTEVHAALSLILNLFDSVCGRCGLARNLYEKPLGKLIEFPIKERLSLLKEALVFDKDSVRDLADKLQIDCNIIEQFTIGEGAESLNLNYPAVSPLNRRPFMDAGNCYILLQPVANIECLIDFIWEKAKQHECMEALRGYYNDVIWFNTLEILPLMQWGATNIILPTLSPNLHCKELIYIFDLNKLAYVCLLEGGFESSNIETTSSPDDVPQSISDNGDLILKRHKEVLEYLHNIPDFKEFKILSLYVMSEVGFPQGHSFPEPATDRLCMYFRFSELQHLIYSEEPDPLLLWKFAKTFADVYEACEMEYLGGMLDVFVCYKDSKYSLWPIDNKVPEELIFMPGCSGIYSGYSISTRDEHLAYCIEEDNTVLKYVYKYCSYAPFYREVGSPHLSPLLLEDFVTPTWVINEQQDTHHEILISSQMEMIGYWLHKLKPYVEKYLSFLKELTTLNIRIRLDSRFKKEMRLSDMPAIDLAEIQVPVRKVGREIIIEVPVEISRWYSQPNNEAERHIMRAVLKAMISWGSELVQDSDINSIIDAAIPLGRAKMSSMLYSPNNLQLENRYLPAYRSVQQADISSIEYDITHSYGLMVTPVDISSIANKKNLCNRIYAVLQDKMLEKLFQFDTAELLPILINLNEACVQQKALRAFDLPARISVISSEKQEIFNLIKKEHERAKTALSVRCLIELIVAYDPRSGIKLPNFDEIDELIALMGEMIAWGTLSDGIHHGLYDPTIKLLKCGRVEVDYLSINSNMIPFELSKTTIEINQYNENYEELFIIPPDDITGPSSEVKKLEDIFELDYGIGLFKLYELMLDLVELIRRNNSSSICYEDKVLYKELRKSKHKWTDAQISSAMEKLTLLCGWEIGNPPQGYIKSDTSPWHYNRPLSFLYRPIARLVRNNRICYYWSYRHLLAAFENLMSLLYKGRLKSPRGGAIEKFVRERWNKKGKEFRDTVCEWIRVNSKFVVIPGEVQIGPSETLMANENLGDIDILAFDTLRNTAYSIECKNTAGARSVHEIKIEIESYFGSKEGVEKHIRRDLWLKQNASKLNSLVNDVNSYQVKSIVITSEEIPSAYIKQGTNPMKIVSFPMLEKMGISILNE